MPKLKMVNRPKTASIFRRGDALATLSIMLFGAVQEDGPVTPMAELAPDLDRVIEHIKLYLADPMPFAKCDYTLTKTESGDFDPEAKLPNRISTDIVIESNQDEIFHNAILRGAFPLLERRYRIQIGDLTPARLIITPDEALDELSGGD